MFGGGLSHVWPFAAIANHYFDGFPDRFSKSVAISEKVITTREEIAAIRDISHPQRHQYLLHAP
jgi:hypothetical protein